MVNIKIQSTTTQQRKTPLFTILEVFLSSRMFMTSISNNSSEVMIWKYHLLPFQNLETLLPLVNWEQSFKSSQMPQLFSGTTRPKSQSLSLKACKFALRNWRSLQTTDSSQLWAKTILSLSGILQMDQLFTQELQSSQSPSWLGVIKSIWRTQSTLLTLWWPLIKLLFSSIS